MVTCPRCHGAKLLDVLTVRPTHWARLPCPQCDGAGEVSETMLGWIEKGRQMRAERMDRGVVLRREAERLGVSPSLLSAAEQGIIDPERMHEYESVPCPR